MRVPSAVPPEPMLSPLFLTGMEILFGAQMLLHPAEILPAEALAAMT